MKPELILESLTNLDPENKDHWTANGQPLLSAVGEGVSRQQILDVAPLFSRENPVLPDEEPELTDEEVKKTLEEELLEVQAKMEAAKAEIKAASEAKVLAESRLDKAKQALDQIRRDEMAKDTRTDTEINMDYLKSEFNQRLARAQQRSHIVRLLEQSDLTSSDIRILTASPVDRAIAERVIKERRERNKRGR